MRVPPGNLDKIELFYVTHNFLFPLSPVFHCVLLMTPSFSLLPHPQTFIEFRPHDIDC